MTQPASPIRVGLIGYGYAGKTFQVMVNANTGEVVGDRPWSVPKIVAAVLAVLVVVGVIVALVLSGGSGAGSTP